MLDVVQSILGRQTQVRAKVVCWNGVPCLIASFKRSVPPQVWQMDLENLRNYSLKLVEKEGEWDMGYLVPEGKFTPFAHFEDRPSAEIAYDAVQRALISGAVCGTSHAGSLAQSKLLRFVRVVLMILGVVFIYITLRYPGPSSQETTPGSLQAMQNATGRLAARPAMMAPPVAAVPAPAAPPKIEVGVPMNADDILPKDVE